ncbi:hypothetical protein SAMN05428945_3354 [Streptomyces sp. 2224.1]|uniref:DUF6243 family protein n=1 Tax=unclassified Streptomyces TaxID=2593676 RepID=UPI00088438BB|nr:MULTISPECIES: DUF6243 family protein [unclassified Streptomyces]PBC82090.1 hypothetical protein BX261_1972 [Streptomyces sp. 2321.6]SDR51527.1 hypothetical protein SAMN05216511_5241 [Streptomyces sp. KS_16]SEC43137.1 hypothetical protein SAMN05428940_1974 [Streptomyces sp. 2133.1]SEC60425.1 hypothetical protein SAMN05428945_3354 [Streptomyces sp. 2224.1]SEF02000.1 hypothetical protein SAMN05428954_5300 [Streptomyces sp. 2112.3]
MSKGHADGMLGVGGTRAKLSRGALRGGGATDRAGRGRSDARERRSELLRKFQDRAQGK